jgi:lipid-A-disaccharide synthase-like uncharacterized protein
MDWLKQLLWHNGHLLGVEWGVWKVIGWAGNIVFSSRVAVQWYVAERKKRAEVPVSYWWLSLGGSFLLLIYSLKKLDSVFIFSYLFAWIPYIRNLILHHRHKLAHLDCGRCGKSCAPHSNYCASCGARLEPTAEKDAVTKH